MPFAILAPASDSKDEAVMHWNAVRLRVTGTGKLRMTMQTLDNVRSFTLAPLTMATATDREPAVLGNLSSQRMQLKIETIDIDEVFSINRVILFAKTLWSQYINS